MSFVTEFIRQIENNPAYLHVGLMCLATIAVGVFTVIIHSKTPDDDECFSETQEKSLEKFNEETVKEEFTNYEEDDDDNHPDMVLVIRTNYKVGSQLIKDNAVIQFVDFYPARFVVLREKDLERYHIIDTYAQEENEEAEGSPEEKKAKGSPEEKKAEGAWGAACPPEEDQSQSSKAGRRNSL